MKKYYFLFGEGSKVNQVICAVIINLLIFAYGNSIGWMSPMTLLLQDPEKTPTEAPLSDSVVSWMAATPYIVCVSMNFLTAYMGDNIGRKRTMLFLSASAMCTWIVNLISMEPWAFILARVFTGIPMAGCFVIGPMYTKEISEDSIRGSLGSLIILFNTLGNLFLYVIGDYLPYRTILWICLSIPTLHVIMFLMMPESPSYLLKRGKTEEATRVLAWLRCRSEEDPVVQTALQQLQKEKLKDDESSQFALKVIWHDKILFRAFRIGLFVTMAREFCGIHPILNFAGDIFATASQDTGLSLTPNQQAMMLGAMQVFGSVLGISTVEKAGRKPLLFATSLLSGISMCSLSSWFLAKSLNMTTPDWLPLLCLCLCIFCDSMGLQPVSVIIIGEIFSFKYRAIVIAVFMAIAAVLDVFQLLFFKPLANSVGIYLPFYIFGGICLSIAIYTLLVVPETKNKSLEEIYECLMTKKERELEKVDKKEIENKIEL